MTPSKTSRSSRGRSTAVGAMWSLYRWYEFPDMRISPLSRRVPDTTAGVIRAAGLPVRTIRTYHPEYLQRSRQLGLLSVISPWAGLCPQPAIGASQTHAVNQRPDSEIGSTRRRPR